MRPSVRFGSLAISGGVAYSTGLSQDHWSMDASALFGDETSVGLTWIDRSERTFESVTNPQLVNTAVSLFGGADYFDYYRRRGVEVAFGHAPGGNRLNQLNIREAKASVAIRIEQHDALETSTSYDVLGTDNNQRANAPITSGDLRSVVVGFSLNPSDIPISITGQRSLYIDVESAPAFLGSDFDFTSIRVRADWTQQTFGQRRLLPATLDVRVVASTFVGNLPPQRFGILDVSPEPFSMFGSFRASGDIPYRGQQTAAVFWEHNFRTIPFELVGLAALADRNYGLTVFGGHGTVRTDDVGRPRHEIGVSLTGIIGIFRVDAAKRLDASGYGFGFGIARLF